MLLFQCYTHRLYSPSTVTFLIADLIVDEYYIGKTRLTIINNNKLVKKYQALNPLSIFTLCLLALKFNFNTIVGAETGLSALIRIFRATAFLL